MIWGKNNQEEDEEVDEQGNPYSQLGYSGHSKGHERDARVLRKYVQATQRSGGGFNQAASTAMSQVRKVQKAREKGVIENKEKEE